METTANYGLKKLADGDPVDILKMSYNMEVIDVELKKKADSSDGSLSGMTVKTVDSTATKFPVPVAGESAKTFLGKVKKFLEDTKSWMNGVCLLGQLVNNCVTNNPNLPLAAAQGKVLMDLYTQLNSDLDNCLKYRGAVGKTTNIYTLSPGIYSLIGERNDYMPSELSPFGNLIIMPGGFNYVTAMYIDSSYNVAFSFCNKSIASWEWNIIPFNPTK